jgi:UDP-glucuronate 4-epimerase
MIILITGIAGFIGFHTSMRMIRNGHIVVGIDNLNDYYDPSLKIDRLSQLGVVKIENEWVSNNDSLHFIFGDISDINTWSNLIDFKIDSVIHLAAQAGVRYSLVNPFAYVNSNILGFQYLMDFCVEAKIYNILYASSSSVYGKSEIQPLKESQICNTPESFYAATKISNEAVAYSYFKTKGLNTIGLRFFTVYGPWGRPDMAPFLFAMSSVNLSSIQVFNNGLQMRDFTFIDDIVDGIELSFDYLNFSGFNNAIVLNLGRGNPINLLRFIKILELNLGVTLVKEFKPAQIGDVNVTYADTTLISTLTGYSPKYDLEDGIKIFIDWFKEYYLIE